MNCMNKAAQALGRMARGKPKRYSAEEIARRTKLLADYNAARKRAKPHTFNETASK